MKQAITAAALLAACTFGAAAQQTTAAIGTWKAYMSYNDITRIVRHGHMAYVVASGNLYTYDTTDRSVVTYDKVNALNDCEIADIAWVDGAKKLVVLYGNNNIDIIDESGNVQNLPDYYNKSLALDKTVNSLTASGRNAYLATGFGVVVINAANATISDTYNLGVKVNRVAINGSTIYAVTAEGVYRADLADNLADKSNWHMIIDYVYNYVATRGNDLFVANNSGFSQLDPATGRLTRLWTPWFTDMKVENGTFYFYGSDHTYIYTSATDRIELPRKFTGLAADPSDGTIWATDTDGTLCNLTLAADGTLTTVTTGIRPDGPRYNYFGFMRHAGGKLYTTGGTDNPERPACIQVLDGDTWNIYDDTFAASLGNNYRTAYALALDPSNPDHVYVGMQSGLYEFNGGKMAKAWNKDNSPLVPALPFDEDNYTQVSALTTTSDGHLWCFNNGSRDGSSSLFELSGDTWTSHHSSDYNDKSGKSMREARSMFTDSRSLLWWSNNDYRLPAIVCYQPSTGEKKIYSSFVNEDGTRVSVSSVACLAEDNANNIWLGTNSGPLMLEASEISSGGETFTQVKVPRNDGTNLADYLLSGVSITAMAIDGAGRKWFGTDGNGVYLISADNLTQELHFTESNSPLLSDDIESVAVNDATGEVYIGTDKGLCSYMGDATQPSDKMTKDNVYAYPNPVTPDYTGLVTVVGLTLDADVKIVTASGTLVASGRSNGGTFTWDCTDRSGKRVASGVYMVETATSSGGKGTVCKIAVVN